MNKYLMLSAAALMVSGAAIPASAGTTRIGFSGFCDGLELSTSDGFIYSMKHLYTGCGETSSTSAAALAGRNKKFEEAYGIRKWVFGDPSDGQDTIGWAVQLPVRSGNLACVIYQGASCSPYYTGYAPSKGALSYLKSSGWAAKKKAKEVRAPEAANR